jgi:hypothetical protein
VLIGCGQLSSGRRFELVGYRLAGRKRGSLCIDVHYPDSGESSGCGTNRVHGGGAIDATGVTRTAGKPATVTGATRGNVKRVTLRYELGGTMRRERAALVVVRDPDLLQVIKVSKPFGLTSAKCLRRRALSAPRLAALEATWSASATSTASEARSVRDEGATAAPASAACA